MPAFHIGTLNRYSSAAANLLEGVAAARHAAASSPIGSAPAKTAILACAAAGPNAGRVPSHRSQVWISVVRVGFPVRRQEGLGDRERFGPRTAG